MKLFDVLYENDPCCEDCYETVYVDDNGDVLSEGAVRQFKIINKKEHAASAPITAVPDQAHYCTLQFGFLSGAVWIEGTLRKNMG